MNQEVIEAGLIVLFWLLFGYVIADSWQTDFIARGKTDIRKYRVYLGFT